MWWHRGPRTHSNPNAVNLDSTTPLHKMQAMQYLVCLARGSSVGYRFQGSPQRQSQRRISTDPFCQHDRCYEGVSEADWEVLEGVTGVVGGSGACANSNRSRTVRLWSYYSVFFKHLLFPSTYDVVMGPKWSNGERCYVCKEGLNFIKKRKWKKNCKLQSM